MTDETNQPEPNANGGETEDKKSFTQAELDRMFSDRAKQASQSAVGQLLQGLGLANTDELKTLVQTAKDAEQARLSDLERAQKELDKYRNEAEQAKGEAQRAVELANLRLMESAVLAEASNPEHKFRPEALKDVWAFVDKSQLSIAEDGTVQGVSQAVKAVAKAKGYMTQAQPQPGPGTPPRSRFTGPQLTPNGNIPEQTFDQPIVKL